jgi:transcriptional regulator with XRE-family HTH domain
VEASTRIFIENGKRRVSPMGTKDREPILVEVGSRIRGARLAAGLNLQQLARLTGVSIGALSQIETGKRDVRLTTLARIAAALRQTPAALLGSPAEAWAGEREQAPLPGSEGYDLGEYE